MSNEQALSALFERVEKTASPSIKFCWKNGVLEYEFYVDFEASPMIMKDYSSSDRAFFEQAFENLLHDFEDFLENQEIIEGQPWSVIVDIFSESNKEVLVYLLICCESL